LYSVIPDRFWNFSVELEGYAPWPYLDILGLLTTGVGNLVNDMASFVSLPWKHADGRLALSDEKATAFKLVKSATNLCRSGGGAFKSLTDLRLDEQVVRNMVRLRMFQNESYLRDHIPGWDDLPADAQFACHSMAWAMGSGFVHKFPKFCAALEDRDFKEASSQCGIADAQGTVIARNFANQQMLLACIGLPAENYDDLHADDDVYDHPVHFYQRNHKA
jgi:hypothetical protein